MGEGVLQDMTEAACAMILTILLVVIRVARGMGREGEGDGLTRTR